MKKTKLKRFDFTDIRMRRGSVVIFDGKGYVVNENILTTHNFIRKNFALMVSAKIFLRRGRLDGKFEDDFVYIERNNINCGEGYRVVKVAPKTQEKKRIPIIG